MSRCPHCAHELSIDTAGGGRRGGSAKRILLCDHCWTVVDPERARDLEPAEERRDLA